MLHRFDLEMHRQSGIILRDAGEVEALQDVQRFHQSDAPRRGQRHGDHLIPAIGRQQRGAVPNDVRGKVAFVDDAPVFLHFAGESLGHGASVEEARSLVGNRLDPFTICTT